MQGKLKIDNSYRLTADGKIYRKGKKLYANKDLYVGEFVDGMKHGKGKLTSINGDKYKGEFERNLFHGYGIQTWTPFYDDGMNGERGGNYILGKKYEGEFQKGFKHGQGYLNSGDGDIYTGMFRNDCYEGLGTLRSKNGDKYNGEWLRGKPNGRIHIKFINGDVFDGNMCMGKYHGQGKIVYSHEKGSYDGYFNFGKFHGTGTRVFSNGNKYVGTFFDGEIQGEGTMFYANGDQYVGEWSCGHFSGKGVVRYGGRGEQFEGSFLKGVFYGEGTLRFADGGYYTGQFANESRHVLTDVPFPVCDGLRHGFGLRVWSNGNRFQGQWQHGKMDGNGVLTDLMGCKYEGQFCNNLRHGVGKEVFGNLLGIPYCCPMGRRHPGQGFCLYTGSWTAGAFNGIGEFLCCDGRTYQGDWRLGKRHGQGRQTYLRDGDTGDSSRLFIGGVDSLYRIASYKGSWDQDTREGTGEITFINGDSIHGVFRNGQPNGWCVCKFALREADNGIDKAGRPKPLYERKALFKDGYRVEWMPHNLNINASLLTWLVDLTTNKSKMQQGDKEKNKRFIKKGC